MTEKATARTWAFVDRRDPNDPDKLIGSFEQVPAREPPSWAIFGELIRLGRIEREIRLREMAAATRLTPAQYSAMEQGRYVIDGAVEDTDPLAWTMDDVLLVIAERLVLDVDDLAMALSKG